MMKTTINPTIGMQNRINKTIWIHPNKNPKVSSETQPRKEFTRNMFQIWDDVLSFTYF